jgi:hypothetical protein
MLGACPLAFGYGRHAFLCAPDRWWACTALALAGFELIVWCLIMVSAAGLTLLACAVVLGYGYLALRE